MLRYKSFKSLTIVIAIVFASCSNNQMESELDTPKTNEKLNSAILTQMSSFNDSIIKTRPTTMGVYSRACIIAGDISGAIGCGKAGFWAGGLFGPQAAIGGATLGALIGGVSGSYVAYRGTRTRAVMNGNIAEPMKVVAAYAEVMDSDIKIDQYKPQKINVDYPIQDESITLLGTKHNLILQNLLDNKTNSKAVEKYFTKQELEILNSKEYIEVYDSIMNQIDISGALSLNGNDVSSRLINLFNQVVAQYPQNGDDMEFLINKYIEAVKVSNEISDEDKKIIYQSLSVAASSFEFWDKQIDK